MPTVGPGWAHPRPVGMRTGVRKGCGLSADPRRHAVDELRIPVLVVGGSLVGLTTSVLLAAQGVPHLLVERHRGTAVHPRAASFHQGTMEVFRSVGLQEAVEAARSEEHTSEL